MPESWTASGRRSASCRARLRRVSRAKRPKACSARVAPTARASSPMLFFFQSKTARLTAASCQTPCPNLLRWARRLRTTLLSMWSRRRRCTGSGTRRCSRPPTLPTRRNGSLWARSLAPRGSSTSRRSRTATKRKRCLSSTAAMMLEQSSRFTMAMGWSCPSCPRRPSCPSPSLGVNSPRCLKTRRRSARRFCRADTSTSCLSAALARRGGSTAQ